MRLFLKLLGGIFLIMLFSLLLLEMMVGYWYKRDVVEKLQSLANSSFESSVQFEDVTISALKNFPQITITVTDLYIHESEYEIFASEKIALHANLFDIYQENYSVSRVEILNSKFYAPIDSLGNKYMVRVKKKKSTKGGSNILFDIPSIEIKDALIIAHNSYKKNKVRISVTEGSFRLKSFDDLLEFKGQANGVLDTMISKGKLSQVNVPIAAKQTTFRINTLDNKSLFDGVIQLYDAQLKAYGVIKPVGNGNLLDITLTGDRGGIEEYLTLVPQVRALGFEQHNPDAYISLTLHNSGYVDPVSYPYLDVKFELHDASLSRKGLVGRIDSVNLKGSFTNGKNKDASTSEIIVDYGRVKVDSSFFEISGSIKNFTNPYVDIDAESIVELEDLNTILNFPDLSMAGKIFVHADLNGKLEELDKMHLSIQNAFNGHIKFKDVAIRKKPSNIFIHNLQGEVYVENSKITMQSLRANYNGGTVLINGYTNNFIPIINRQANQKTHAKFELNVNDLSLKESDLQSTNSDTTSGLSTFRFPKFLDLQFDVGMKNFSYENYLAEYIGMQLSLNSDSMMVNNGQIIFDEGNISVDATSRPSESGIKNFEVWLKADIDHLDSKRYLSDSSNSTDKTSDTLQMAGINLHSDLRFKKITHDNIVLEDVSVRANIKNEKIDAKTTKFTFPYGKVNSSFKLDLSDSLPRLRGSSSISLHSFDTDSIKKYYNKIKPKGKHVDSMDIPPPSQPKLIIEKFSFDISAPKVTYQEYEVTNLETDLHIRNNRVRLNLARFNMFDGTFNLSGLIRRNDQREVKAFCNIAASNIDLGDITASFAGPSKEMFSKQHFKGAVGVNGQILLKYNHELEHQEDEMLGKVNISLSEGELIHFPPISESLKFIKQANRDTVLLANQDLEILFHNEEVLLPTTTFTTSLSNIEFSGYQSKDFEFGFDLQISVGDLLFKSQKKKKEQVAGTKKASFGAIKHFLKARTINGKMQVKSMKKRAYHEELELLSDRYKHVDSVLNTMNLQIVQ